MVSIGVLGYPPQTSIPLHLHTFSFFYYVASFQRIEKTYNFNSHFNSLFLCQCLTTAWILMIGFGPPFFNLPNMYFFHILCSFRLQLGKRDLMLTNDIDLYYLDNLYQNNCSGILLASYTKTQLNMCLLHCLWLNDGQIATRERCSYYKPV